MFGVLYSIFTVASLKWAVTEPTLQTRYPALQKYEGLSLATRLWKVT